MTFNVQMMAPVSNRSYMIAPQKLGRRENTEQVSKIQESETMVNTLFIATKATRNSFI